jgi:Phage capsid family
MAGDPGVGGMTAWRQPAPTGPEADEIVRRLMVEGRLGPGSIEGQAQGGGQVEGGISAGEQSEFGEQRPAEADDPAEGPGLSSPDSLSSPPQDETWPELDPAAHHSLAGRLVLGYPVYLDPFMPAMANTAESIAFGALDRYFVRIVNGVRFERSDEFRFQHDLVAFRCIIRLDGALIDTNAVKTFVNTT